MVATIGIMMGFYIITRCVEILSSKEAKIITKLFSGLTIFIVVISMMSLISTGTSSELK